jgi:hypothetical protein
MMVFTVKSVKGSHLIEVISQTNGIKRSSYLSPYQATELIRELTEALSSIERMQ